MRTQSKTKKISKVVQANEASRKFVLASLGAVSLVQKLLIELEKFVGERSHDDDPRES